MFKFLKAIKKLFFNYIDHARVIYRYGRDHILYTIVKALSEPTPYLQLLALIKNDPNCDVLDYALGYDKDDFKIWYNGNMLNVNDVISNLVKDFLMHDIPNLENRFDQKGNTIFHTVAQQRPDLLPGLLRGLSPQQFFYTLNMENNKGETVLQCVKQQGLDKALKLFEKFSNDELIEFFNMKLKISHINQDGNSEIIQSTVLHSLAQSDPDLLSNLLDGFSNEQLTNLLKIQNDKKDTVLCTLVQQRPDLLKNLLPELFDKLSHKQFSSLFSTKSNNNILSLIAQHKPILLDYPFMFPELFEELSKEQSINFLNTKTKFKCDNTVLHIVARYQPNLLPILLKGLSKEQLTNFLKMRNEEEDTVLHILAESNTEVFLDLLVKNIQNKQAIELLSIKNNKNHTPLYYAASNNNLLDFMLELIEKVDLQSITNFKPFINFINIKCDGDITLAHMILKEPYGNKWEQVVKQIPGNELKQILQNMNSKGNLNITLDEPKKNLLLNKISNKPLEEADQDLKQLIQQTEELSVSQPIGSSRTIA